MTDIILIQPKGSPIRKLTCLPLGLLSISRFLAKEGYNIKIINQVINDKWESDLQSELKKNIICVGVTAMIGDSIRGGIIASKFVKENGNIPVIWGGPHPSILPVQTLKEDYIDIVCEGEGDITFYELVKTLEKNKPLDKVRGIWYKENKKIKKTEKRPQADLNKLPEIPYDIIDMSKYYTTTWYKEKNFTINVETSRGCPFHCTYCYNPNLYSNWRDLKPEKVIELLKTLKDTYKVRSFHFQDDNFFVNQKRTNKIMKSIIKEKLDIIMGFQGLRLDAACRMEKNELDLMFDAGTKYFNIGLETGSPRILKMIKKGTSIDQAYNFNKILTNYPDVYPHYNFMAGFPTETKEEMFMTVNMMARLIRENPNVQIISLYLFIPWPKTDIYDLSIKEGLIPPDSLKEWINIRWGLDVDDEASRFNPWLDKEFIELYKRILLTIHTASKTNVSKISNFFVRNLTNIYAPIAKFRFYNSCFGFMPEYVISKKITRLAKVLAGY